MILSDLKVHKEQNPRSCIYFNPHDAHELAEILYKFWTEKKEGTDHLLGKSAQEDLTVRMKQFGRNYMNIVDNIKKV